MVEFQILMDISNANDTEALAALSWLKDNYGAQIPQAFFRSMDKKINGYLLAATFNDAVSVIQALKAQFTDRLIKYDLQISE